MFKTGFVQRVCFLFGGGKWTLKELEEASLKALAIFESEQEASTWVEWGHQWTKPAETNVEKLLNIALAAVTEHCAKCMNLNGCQFVKKKMPEHPLHPNCHCVAKKIARPIAGVTAFARMPIEKLTKYAFVDPAKKHFFESNGYGIMDAKDMQFEFERQAAKKYAQGDYTLGKLDDHGQRITIRIELPRRIGSNSTHLCFEAGWMVYPFGKITNTTPATSLSSK